MREELDKLLCKKYPKMMVNRHASVQETAMCWGFSHGDGWFNIIDTLCWFLYRKYDAAKSRHDYLVSRLGKPRFGEKGVAVTQEDIDEAKVRVDEEAVKIPTVVQVKEKFGTLRFYIQAGTDEHYNYISFAESMSGCTCETCGKPGKRLGGGWIYTSCEEHAHDDDWAESLKVDDDEE